MKFQTSLVGQQTRLSEWAEQIKDCQNRPQGMKIDKCCQLQGITKANYYWRLRKVREAFLEETDITPPFVKLLVPAQTETTAAVTSKVVAILKGTLAKQDRFDRSSEKIITRKFSFSFVGNRNHQWKVCECSSFILIRTGIPTLWSVYY